MTEEPQWSGSNENYRKRVLAIHKNPLAKAKFDEQLSALQMRAQKATSGRMHNDFKIGDGFSSAGNRLGYMLAQNVRDSRGLSVAEEIANGGNFSRVGSHLAAMGGQLYGAGLDLAGRLVDGKAESAAQQAGAQVEIQNERAREGIMAQAENDMRDMNMQNAATGMSMTDNAIGQANAFESGMQGIAMSGIEGSSNMERNLQYGQSRADAAEQLQFEMMNNGAQDYEDSMAKSFSDLSQNKAGAMTNAWAGTLYKKNADLTAGRMQAGAQEKKDQPEMNDYQAAILKAQAGGAAKAALKTETVTTTEKVPVENISTQQAAAIGVAEPPQGYGVNEWIRAATADGTGWQNKLVNGRVEINGTNYTAAQISAWIADRSKYVK